jgi:hypothetical protein
MTEREKLRIRVATAAKTLADSLVDDVHMGEDDEAGCRVLRNAFERVEYLSDRELEGTG